MYTSSAAFDFILANITSVYVRQIKSKKHRGTPFTLRDSNVMVKLVTCKIAQVRHLHNDLSLRVSFSLGLDVTVVVPGYQLLLSEGMVVDGADPNHK